MITPHIVVCCKLACLWDRNVVTIVITIKNHSAGCGGTRQCTNSSRYEYVLCALEQVSMLDSGA